MFSLWLLFACQLCAAKQNAAIGNGLNVLLIVSDDLRPDISDHYGNSQISTPNINRLQNEAITFTHSYCQMPLCNPSRTSFLTGLRPDATRVWRAGYFRETMPNNTGYNVITLPQYFKNIGNYFVTGGGKVFHPGSNSGGPSSSEGGADEPYSWSEAYWYCDQFHNATFQSLAMQNWPNGTGCVQNIDCIKCLQSYNSYGNGISPAYRASSCESLCYPEGAVANYFNDLLVKIKYENYTKNKPFFIALGLKRPHLSWFAPQSYFDEYPINSTKLALHNKPPINMPPAAFSSNNSEICNMDEFHNKSNPLNYVYYVNNSNYSANITDGYYNLINDTFQYNLRSAYYSTVSWNDNQFGVIMDLLQFYGYWNNTIIVFMADHGFSLGELGIWCKNTAYELSIRVPTIIRIPNINRTNIVIHDIIESIDIYPTLLDAANLPKNNANHGKSLMPLIMNDTNSSNNNAVAYSQVKMTYYANNGSVYPNMMAVTMRTNNWRYTEYIDYNLSIAMPKWNVVFGVELYNHSNDIYGNENDMDSYENENLAYYPQYQSVVETMHNKLINTWPQIGNNMYESRENKKSLYEDIYSI
eukprot:428899_1